MIQPQDDDIIPIGKLRRSYYPTAAVSWDPTYGIRIENENVPPEPAAAGTWCRQMGGFIRVDTKAKRSQHTAVRAFLKAWRSRP